MRVLFSALVVAAGLVGFGTQAQAAAAPAAHAVGKTHRIATTQTSRPVLVRKATATRTTLRTRLAKARLAKAQLIRARIARAKIVKARIARARLARARLAKSRFARTHLVKRSHTVRFAQVRRPGTLATRSAKTYRQVSTKKA